MLPFENLNRDAELDFFAAGISDALTTELSNIASLQVISRQSVLAVARGDTTLAEIARRLRVDAVIEGSALQAGERVRITAQLIRAEPERHVWAQSYVADMRDILELQGSVARAVAEAVEAALTPSEVARLTRPRPIHPEAQTPTRGIGSGRSAIADEPKTATRLRHAAIVLPSIRFHATTVSGGPNEQDLICHATA